MVGARPRRLGIVGTGLIARYVHTFLEATGWTFDEISLHDTAPASVDGFRDYLERSAVTGTSQGARDRRGPGRRRAIWCSSRRWPPSRTCTTSGASRTRPWCCTCPCATSPPEILLGSTNIVDDVEHCLKADTSPHLAEQLTGTRDFLAGTLYDVMAGRLRPCVERPVVFSPFGLGVLDLAVGQLVHAEVARAGELDVVDGFFDELSRHGTDRDPTPCP